MPNRALGSYKQHEMLIQDGNKPHCGYLAWLGRNNDQLPSQEAIQLDNDKIWLYKPLLDE